MTLTPVSFALPPHEDGGSHVLRLDWRDRKRDRVWMTLRNVCWTRMRRAARCPRKILRY